jgi:hypothetical protein
VRELARCAQELCKPWEEVFKNEPVAERVLEKKKQSLRKLAIHFLRHKMDSIPQDMYERVVELQMQFLEQSIIV